MNQSFYIGAVGAHQQLRNLNVHADNIANVNTFGFKADRVDFSSLMYQDHRGVEDDLPMGVGAKLLMTSTNFNQGAPSPTGRPLDYMIDGEGFFGLMDLDTGEITFTRCGAFYMAGRMEATGEVDANGQPVTRQRFYLSDGEGRFVLSDTGGLIEVTESTDYCEKLPIGIFDYGNYNGMTQLNSTRFIPIDKNGGLWRGTGTLVQGVLEMSNADLGDEMTKVIEAQRAYGLALKVVQTSDEIETTINALRN